MIKGDTGMDPGFVGVFLCGCSTTVVQIKAVLGPREEQTDIFLIKAFLIHTR